MNLRDKLVNPQSRASTFSPRPELLLQSNTVRPLHMVVPRTILGQEWWDKTRKDAYRKNGYRCAACGVDAFNAKESQALEGHKVYRIDYLAGRQTYLETVALCHYCHNFIHNGRMEALRNKSEMTAAKYNKIMRHGRKVLRLAGLTKPVYKEQTEALRWDRWRLVLFGIEYPPLFKNHGEWLKHFGYEDE